MNDNDIPKATHDGNLKIGDFLIKCAVLQNGTRVITQRSLYGAIGKSVSTGTLRGPKNGAHQPPRILAASNLTPYISEELRCALNPFQFRTIRGHKANGYRAEILPEICNVYLDARQAGVLNSRQQELAAHCEILVRGFARIGIIALIDEATGYQEDRERDELSRLLAIYLSEERLKWAKQFPDEFYRLIYKLKNWPYPTGGGKNPYVGKLTNELVYEKLPPGVLEELRVRNPVNSIKKRRQWCHHQFLSEDIGQPDLRNHLLQVIALLRASANWNIFKRLFARAFPTKAQMEEQRQGGLFPDYDNDLI